VALQSRQNQAAFAGGLQRPSSQIVGSLFSDELMIPIAGLLMAEGSVGDLNSKWRAVSPGL